MNQVFPIDAVIRLSLLKLYELTAISGVARTTAEQVAGAIGHGVSKGFVSVAFRQMAELEWLRVESIGGTSSRVSLTPQGAREAEKELRDPKSLIYRFQREGAQAVFESAVEVGSVPASDRFVTSQDNLPEFEQFDASLEALETELQKSNEAGDIFGDDKAAVIEEVGALRSIITASKVRAVVVLQFARSSLGWIAEKAGGAAIGELAKKALALAIAWISS